MTSGPPRVALFTDSFHEVNGVALTARQLDAFACRRGYPFFNCHAGPETEFSVDGAAQTFELQRGRFQVQIEKDLFVDPNILRYRKCVRAALEAFQPDIVHITGPNDISILGWLLARKLKIPMTASWHTNVHEFAAWRLRNTLRFFPDAVSGAAARAAESLILKVCTELYGVAKIAFAPNPELIDMIHRATKRPVYVMHRGVEIDLYKPELRSRSDKTFRMGFVGRISAEKNVKFLKVLEDGLLAAGKTDFEIVVIGHGSEQEWLEENLTRGVFPGVLKGETLARAYADFDLFVFPSFTDTYGNVINESMASGVPCIVTTGGGPKYLIKDGETGIVAKDDQHFIESVLAIMDDPARHAEMRRASRAHAVANSWDKVFERLYGRYAEVAERFPVRTRQSPVSEAVAG